MNDLKNWIRIRKDLYQQMRAQVRHRLGDDVIELERYQQKYDQEFRKKWSPATPNFLWDEIAQSQLVLMGDFHALKQSQKAQLRVLRHIPPSRKQILAVEFFEASHQKWIDQFLQGALSEKDFLLKIHWQKNWGFPWDHYRPLVRWAQKHKIRIVGLNKKQKKLDARDDFSGKIIAGLIRKNPDHLVFVIFGDLHLAQSHLPRAIKEQLGDFHIRPPLRIFQNVEKIYFQLLGQELESSTDLVRQGKHNFCLMSVPPWVKWQNYLLYLEEAYDQELDEDDENIDYTDHVSRYVKIIADELKVSVSLSELSVYTAKDTQLWSLLEEHFSAPDLKRIEALVADEMSFYLPEVKVAYLARGSVNHAASLAMQFVHAQCSQEQRSFLQMPPDFLTRIWIEAMAYFGSKMINPKRKADTLLDLKSSLSSKNADHGQEAMRLALTQKMHEMMVITGTARPRPPMKPVRKWSFMVAASLLGPMMGERMYFGYRKKLLPLKTIQNFLKKPLGEEQFNMAYYEMVEIVESLPAPFASKKEKL